MTDARLWPERTLAPVDMTGGTASSIDLPWLTTRQMIDVDRIMVDDLGIGLVQMMEHAGRACARVTWETARAGAPGPVHVVVLAGTGGNGGGAMVAARRLAGWGAHISVVLTRPAASLQGVPALQHAALVRMGIDVLDVGGLSQRLDLQNADAVIDGVIGYSLAGPAHGTAVTLIDWANASRAPVVSLDVPSGLDATSGPVGSHVVRASATVTLALPKLGLRLSASRPFVGALYLADIGVPQSVYSRLGLRADLGTLFSDGDVVRLWEPPV